MCFGDSLTWGWRPCKTGVPAKRYTLRERWTGVMLDELGDGYELLEEGLSGRTTNVDDPTDDRLNGSKYLPAALASHAPLDLVILMLGTNDSKTYLRRSPLDIGLGMQTLIGQVYTGAGGIGTSYATPKILLIAPPPVSKIPVSWFDYSFEDAREKLIEVAIRYQSLASFFGIPFLDAGTILNVDGDDGVHFSLDNNRVLGQHAANLVLDTLS